MPHGKNHTLSFFSLSSFFPFFLHVFSNCHTAPALSPLKSLYYYVLQTVRWFCFCSPSSQVVSHYVYIYMFIIPLTLNRVWGHMVCLIISLHFCVSIWPLSSSLAKSLDYLFIFVSPVLNMIIFNKCLLNKFRREEVIAFIFIFVFFRYCVRFFLFCWSFLWF